MNEKRNGKRRRFAPLGALAAFFALTVLYGAAVALLQAVSVPRVFAGGYFAAADKTSAKAKEVSYVLDAGHGGDDGGCSAGEVLEKDLNLAVVQKLGLLLELCGQRVEYTRQDDRALYDEDIKGEHRRRDLKKRLEIAQAQPQAVFLSIHMNRFSDPRYGGMQVFYSPHDARSEELAALLQQACTAYLDPPNTRRPKKAGSNIFLLHRLTTPAVLIECGFLSNERECALLQTPTYQRQIALLLCSALFEQRSREAQG